MSLGPFLFKLGKGATGKLSNDLKPSVFDSDEIMDAEEIKMEIATAKIRKKACAVK